MIIIQIIIVIILLHIISRIYLWYKEDKIVNDYIEKMYK